MNKKIILYIIIGLIFLMPIISIEALTPWVVALFFIHKSIKEFKAKETLKPICFNMIYCGGIILMYNIIARYIEYILIKAWL
ncbi:hypothetical protein KPL39_03920 [Clostridium gasigenes]|uniref:hypothetical protein n=1 Tax=Clostridium gasigenes TaxID=94869 RepID=UPI001C0B5DD6|nr:hypothetical protein [Clostridium gasigenes]MBU3135411.1 hypothetical protein [Clostridium gasigenes]